VKLRAIRAQKLRPKSCSGPTTNGAGTVVSRLTFEIDSDATFLDAKPLFPFASLRSKLFGTHVRKCHASGVQAIVPTAPRTFGQNPTAVVRRSPEKFLTIAPLRAVPVAVAAMPSPISTCQGSPYQAQYKDRLISATQLIDGSWIATHVSMGSDPANDSSAQGPHFFLARAMAIASAEIEIDEWEQPTR
jgi:hypothetical protein